MTKTIGRNRNVNDTPSVSDGIATISDNAITIAVPNPGRTEMTVSVRDENGWVRPMPASDDPSIRKGIFIINGTSHTFSGDDVSTSEYSGINDKNGKTPIFYVTQN